MVKRAEFLSSTVRHLARSVNYHCSICDAPTAGPASRGGKSYTLGDAAHIYAASPGGPRPGRHLSTKDLQDYKNGIWLCVVCAREVDQNRYAWPPQRLRRTKKEAERRAADALKRSRNNGALLPRLEYPIRWEPPAPNEIKAGAENLHHTVFCIAGHRKQRGRAHIDVRIDGDEHSTRGHIGTPTGHALEVRNLRPGDTYRIPVFTTLTQRGTFWLDRFRLAGSGPLPSLQKGTYITNAPFLDGLDRSPLSPGRWSVRVRLELGDAAHRRTFTTRWQIVTVAEDGVRRRRKYSGRPS
jgi:hypothetical protein